LNLYVESSAILAWLLDEPQFAAVDSCLERAELVVSSDLTAVECDRALLRRSDQGSLTESTRAALALRAAAVAAEWTRLPITPSILSRARLRFGDVTVRTLDAIHLATALEARAAVPDLVLLSLDDRVCRAARALGFEVLPA
jgi:predicted nucleic acid-binding protein